MLTDSASHDRIVWLAYVKCASVPGEELPDSAAFSAQQATLGHQVVAVLENSTESFACVIKPGSLADRDAMSAEIISTGGTDKYGLVWALGFVAAGNRLDMAQLLSIARVESLIDIKRRITALEAAAVDRIVPQ